MKEKIELNVDGRMHNVEVDSETPLLYVLRDYLELNGPKYGCGLEQCGACMVVYCNTENPEKLEDALKIVSVNDFVAVLARRVVSRKSIRFTEEDCEWEQSGMLPVGKLTKRITEGDASGFAFPI